MSTTVQAMPSDGTGRERAGHVLLSAYACDPDNGSEPGVGWRLLLASLEVTRHVTLVTRTNNTGRVREELGQRANCTVVGHDLARPWLRLKKALPFGTQVYYVFWQLSARRVLREVHQRSPVDIVHHATIAVDWMPAASRALADEASHVWGPVGGATTCPPGFLRTVGFLGGVAEMARSLLGAAGRRLHGRATARAARLVVAQNADVARSFREHCRELVVEPNAFVDRRVLPQRRDDDVDPHLIVGVGRLLGWKGWALAIGALARMPDQYRLEVFGTGPDEARLRRIARRKGVQDRIVWRGWCSRALIFETMARARCVLHPSLHDSAPGAVAEALTIGTPVVCLDVGGSAAMIAESGGRSVPADSDTCEVALAEALLSPVAPHRVDRWDADRLPALLAGWYAIADRHRRVTV